MLELIDVVKYKVAIYIRLSKEDKDKGFDDSDSVSNQKALLTKFVNELGWEYEIVDMYIDDGYTGTNLKRPGFQRMISDIELGKVNMVVVKDLSRLARNYVEAGNYTENWFPEHNVRVVSVNDVTDSFDKNNGNNDIIPFKAIMNDWYSKDLSKKIKTNLDIMQKQGKWVGGKIALGYMRDPNDKNHLIICEKEAKIIKIIFNMAYLGKNLGEIRKYLIENNIPTANQIRYNKATFWENKAIKNILTNKVYLGTSIQNKRSRISYKNRKLRPNPKSEWNIVENTHEPIVDQKIFDAVQRMVITQKYSRNEKKHIFLLDGMLFCYECGHKIGVRARKNGRYSMVCNNYRRNSKLGLCTSHGFNYEELEKAVLIYIKNLFLDINSEKINLAIEKNRTKYDYSKIMKQKEMEIKKLNENMDKMYIEKLNGEIDEERYRRIYNKFMDEISQKQDEYNQLLNKTENSNQDDIEQIKKIVKKFLSLEQPTAEMMRVIINRIEIHQDKQVDVKFNFKKLNNNLKNVCLF